MDAEVRDFVRQRAGNRCEYCLLPEESDEWPFHVEHVIARQHGGNEDLENLCWSCSRCNLYKGPNIASLDSDTRELAGLYDPRKLSWKDHFTMRDAHILGLSPVGRATVRLLRMNDVRRLDLRRDLIRRGIIQA